MSDARELALENKIFRLEHRIAQLENPWVNYEDELPPKDGTAVLGFYPEFGGYIADQRFVPISWSEWGGGVWDNCSSGQHMNGNPTHWAPLPEPPK